MEGQKPHGHGVVDSTSMCGFHVRREKRVTAKNAHEPPFTHWFMEHVREIGKMPSVPRGSGPVVALPDCRRYLVNVHSMECRWTGLLSEVFAQRSPELPAVSGQSSPGQPPLLSNCLDPSVRHETGPDKRRWARDQYRQSLHGR